MLRRTSGMSPPLGLPEPINTARLPRSSARARRASNRDPRGISWRARGIASVVGDDELDEDYISPSSSTATGARGRRSLRVAERTPNPASRPPTVDAHGQLSRRCHRRDRDSARSARARGRGERSPPLAKGERTRGLACPRDLAYRRRSAPPRAPRPATPSCICSRGDRSAVLTRPSAIRDSRLSTRNLVAALPSCPPRTPRVLWSAPARSGTGTARRALDGPPEPGRLSRAA